jgi:hypothetical protein
MAKNGVCMPVATFLHQIDGEYCGWLQVEHTGSYNFLFAGEKLLQINNRRGTSKPYADL